MKIGRCCRLLLLDQSCHHLLFFQFEIGSVKLWQRCCLLFIDQVCALMQQLFASSDLNTFSSVQAEPLLDLLDLRVYGHVLLLGQGPRRLLLDHGHEAHIVVAFQDSVRQFVHLDLEALATVADFLPYALNRALVVWNLSEAYAVGTLQLERLPDRLLFVLVV